MFGGFSKSFGFGRRVPPPQGKSPAFMYFASPNLSGPNQNYENMKYYYSTTSSNIAAGQIRAIDYVNTYWPSPPNPPGTLESQYFASPTGVAYIGNDTIVICAKNSGTTPIKYSLQTSFDGGKSFIGDYYGFFLLDGQLTGGIYYQNKHWLAINGKLYTTTDFENYTEITLPSTYRTHNIAVLGSIMIVGANGGYYRSPDAGATWTWNLLDSGSGIKKAYASDGCFLLVKDAVENDVRRSTDGITWTEIRLQPGVTATASYVGNTAIWANGRWVMSTQTTSSQGSTSVSVDDGLTWTTTLNTLDFYNNPLKIRYMSYGNGVYIASGGYGDVYTSIDGTGWTREIVIPSKSVTGLVIAYEPPA